mmetsp:Transcript_54291/g.60689  ORF Transcript_54291/g.60689 Transcript_54291/m.60689 type:complete len:463 (-) Transcript_54291:160-1548(-)
MVATASLEQIPAGNEAAGAEGEAPGEATLEQARVEAAAAAKAILEDRRRLKEKKKGRVKYEGLSKKVAKKRERETFIDNSDRPRRITVLYHLHKAGGTSILQLFKKGYGFRSFPDTYNKDEMNQFNEWSSSEGMTIFGKYSDQLKFSTFSTDEADNSRRKKVNTADFWKDLHIKGLDYVSLEANGLPLKILSEASKGAYLVAQFRTPKERLQSTLERELYVYCKHQVSGRGIKKRPVPSNEEFKTCLNKTNIDRENGDADWLKSMEERSKIWGGHMLPNFYVRFLNGLNMEPRLKLTQEHLEIAKRVVSKFDLILLLTEMSDSTKLDKLNKFYQLKGERYPKESNNRLKIDFPINYYIPVHNKIEKAVREHFNEDNQLDIKLYEYIKTLTKMREEYGYIELPTDEHVKHNYPVVFLFLLIPILYRFQKRKNKMVWMLIILSIYALLTQRNFLHVSDKYNVVR